MEASILGRGNLRRWQFVASLHGARICSSCPCAFLLLAVVVSLSLCSFALRPAPPCLSPPHASLTLTSTVLNCPYGLNRLPELPYHPVGQLEGYPQKTITPHAIFPNCRLQKGHRGGQVRALKFSVLPRVRLLALVCQATPRLGLELAWTATQSLLFWVHRCSQCCTCTAARATPATAATCFRWLCFFCGGLLWSSAFSCRFFFCCYPIGCALQRCRWRRANILSPEASWPPPNQP